MDLHLTEQRDAAPVAAIVTQTDPFQPKPPSPRYAPRKTGVDACTQIERADGLFDFDTEVEPILDVIVGKVLEQTVVDMEHAAELAGLATKKVCVCLVHVCV